MRTHSCQDNVITQPPLVPPRARVFVRNGARTLHVPVDAPEAHRRPVRLAHAQALEDLVVERRGRAARQELVQLGGGGAYARVSTREGASDKTQKNTPRGQPRPRARALARPPTFASMRVYTFSDLGSVRCLFRSMRPPALRSMP